MSAQGIGFGILQLRLRNTIRESVLADLAILFSESNRIKVFILYGLRRTGIAVNMK